MITAQITEGGLDGGLGNQLFGLATTMYTAEKHDMEPFFQYVNKMRPHHIYSSFLRKFPFMPRTDISNFRSISEQQLEQIDREVDTKLNGYFQSESYFPNYREKFISLFYLTEQEKETIEQGLKEISIPNKKNLGIHIRRTDYVTLGWDLNIDYYRKALKEFEDWNVVLFSDDVEFCKKHFANHSERIKVYKTNIDYIDLMVMSKMDALIIANSSFSWWATYIGDIKTVIAPTPWFPSTQSYNTNIYRANWKLLETTFKNSN